MDDCANQCDGAHLTKGSLLRRISVLCTVWKEACGTATTDGGGVSLFKNKLQGLCAQGPWQAFRAA